MWDTYHTRGIRTKHLYRFMKLEWGLEFLKTNQMYMSRMDGFEDKFEGIATGNIVTLGLLPLINRNFSYHPQLPNKGIDNIKKIAKQKLIAARQQLAKIQCSNYVSCWFMSDRESVAMWDLYAGINGLAIQLDRKKFQNRIKEMLLDNKLSFVPKSIVAGKVAYHDFHSISRNQRSHMMKYLPFRKDVSFEHEKEYRITLNMGDSVLVEKSLEFIFLLLNLKENHLDQLLHI